MALLFMDSFDHYVTADMTEKWTQFLTAGGDVNPTIVAAAGRRGTFGLRATQGSGGGRTIARTMTTSDPTCIVGFSFNQSTGNWSDPQQNASFDPATTRFGGGSAFLFQMRQAGTTQVVIRVGATGTLEVYRGSAGTLLGATTLVLSVATTYYIELKVVIHPSAGTVDVRVNGITVLALTGQNTRASASSTWDEAVFAHCVTNSANIVWDFDDAYISDGAGAAPWNGFLGDCRVDAFVPSAAGAVTQWTPLAGSNYQNVDDAAPDDDATYNSTTVVGNIDTFVVPDAASAGATIRGVQVNLSAKKSDAGVCTIAPVVRHGTTNYPGADVAPATTYSNLSGVFQTNPGTSAAWVEADFNAAEFGYKRTA
jgi:hypothetical protein